MSEFSMYAEFETEERAQEVLRLITDRLSELQQINRFFYFVDGAKRDKNNSHVVKIVLEYRVSWAISEIAKVLWPVRVTNNMVSIWERPTPAALGVAA